MIHSSSCLSLAWVPMGGAKLPSIRTKPRAESRASHEKAQDTPRFVSPTVCLLGSVTERASHGS